MVISGHESTINILLMFLLTDLSNVDEGYQRLKKIKGYPADFGSSLNVELESCVTCVSGFKVSICFNEEKIVPFFSTNPKQCDLLEFLEYADSLLGTQEFFKFTLRK